MKRGRKAAAIREYLNEHPDAPAKEVIEALSARKIRVSPTQVYGLKSNGGLKITRKVNAYSSLIQAKKIADAMGGVEKARAALDVLAKLTA